MLKGNFWIRLVAVIIIQALLLTQVDFALAAVYHGQESYQEVALKIQKISDKRTSMVSGIACVQLAVSGLKLSRLDLKTVFSILNSFGSSITELANYDGVRNISKQIYKVLANIDYKAQDKNIKFELLKKKKQDQRIKLASIRTEFSTGPPMLNKISEIGCITPNC